MDQPVVIEYRKGPLTGARYVVVSAARAAAVHPDADIVGYEDGRPYEAESATKGKKAVKAADDPTIDWSTVRTMVVDDDGTEREALP